MNGDTGDLLACPGPFVSPYQYEGHAIEWRAGDQDEGNSVEDIWHIILHSLKGQSGHSAAAGTDSTGLKKF